MNSIEASGASAPRAGAGPIAATKANYYSQAKVNPSLIVPKGPDMGFLDLPHDRGRLPKAA